MLIPLRLFGYAMTQILTCRQCGDRYPSTEMEQDGDGFLCPRCRD